MENYEARKLVRLAVIVTAGCNGGSSMQGSYHELPVHALDKASITSPRAVKPRQVKAQRTGHRFLGRLAPRVGCSQKAMPLTCRSSPSPDASGSLTESEKLGCTTN